MSAKSYISDGYTEKGLIKEVPNMHGPVKFEYRVMLSDKIRDILHSWDLISSAEKTRRIHAVILKQVKSWDLEDDNGKAIPLTETSLVHLKKNIVERLFNIVVQLGVADELEGELDLDKVLGDSDSEIKN